MEASTSGARPPPPHLDERESLGGRADARRTHEAQREDVPAGGAEDVLELTGWGGGTGGFALTRTGCGAGCRRVGVRWLCMVRTCTSKSQFHGPLPRLHPAHLLLGAVMRQVGHVQVGMRRRGMTAPACCGRGDIKAERGLVERAAALPQQRHMIWAPRRPKDTCGDLTGILGAVDPTDSRGRRPGQRDQAATKPRKANGRADATRQPGLELPETKPTWAEASAVLPRQKVRRQSDHSRDRRPSDRAKLVGVTPLRQMTENTLKTQPHAYLAGLTMIRRAPPAPPASSSRKRPNLDRD